METYFEVVRHFVFIARIDRHFAELLMLDVALLVRISYTQIETVFLRGTCDADIIVGNKSCLEYFILPVCIGIPVAEIEKWVLFVGKLLGVQLFKLFGIGHGNLVRH